MKHNDVGQSNGYLVACIEQVLGLGLDLPAWPLGAQASIDAAQVSAFHMWAGIWPTSPLLVVQPCCEHGRNRLCS